MSRTTWATRAMTAGKSTTTLAGTAAGGDAVADEYTKNPGSDAPAPTHTPYRCASRISWASVAARIKALLGTQPVFRQSPPIRWASTSVTRALTAAAM